MKEKDILGLTFGVAVLFGFLLFLLAALTILAANESLEQSRDFRQRCERAGGIAFQPKRQWVCLSKSQVQPMEPAK